MQHSNPIQISPAAEKHIQKQIAKEGGGKNLRVSVEKGGCSGLSYVLGLVEKQEAGDLVFPLESGFSVFVEPTSYTYLKGMQIDFVKKGFNGQLVFVNPNVKKTCGCGESFSVEE